jgi:hypothetical protein
MLRLYHWLCFVPALLLTPSLGADEKKGEENWQIDTAVTISPGKAPIPALKYRLFPLQSERKAGDAAPIYLRFAHERGGKVKQELTEKVDKGLEAPLDRLPVTELKAFLGGYRYILNQMDLAARRQTCDWNYTLDVDDTIGILLPDAQELRLYVRLLAVKARVEIVEGNYAAAARSLETGFSFSRQLGDGPFLINQLVGMAVADVLADRVLEWTQRPGAPDLYWALTALPRPLIGMRKGLEFEQRFAEMQFPDLTGLDRPRGPEEWDAALARVNKGWERIYPLLHGLNAKPGQPGNPFPKALGRPEGLPAAKKWLVEKGGYKADRVEAMPPGQVLLLALAGESREWRDEWFKAAYLPYPVGRPLLDDAIKRLEAAPMTDGVALARTFLPALAKVTLRQARLERRIASLRAIEALRLYAAAKGELPDRLDQVKEAPIPPDPTTGKPFDYRRDGRTATLSSRVPGDALANSGLRYRITLRK